MKNPPLVALAFLFSPLAFISIGLITNSTLSNKKDLNDSHIGTAPSKISKQNNKTYNTSKLDTNSPTTIDYAPTFDPRYPFSPPHRNNAKTESLFNPQDDYWGLPRTEGVDEVSSLCSSCHSLEIVMQQRMTADRWTYTLNWMSEKQGMVQLDTDTYDLVYTYLTKHFSDK